MSREVGRGRAGAWAVAMGSLLVASAFLVAPTPVAGAIPDKPGKCAGGWRELPIPRAAFDAVLFDVIVRGGEPAWLLGGSRDGVVSVQRRGSRWRDASGGSGGQKGFVAGDVLGASSVLGAGYARVPVKQTRPIASAVAGGGGVRQETVPDPRGPHGVFADVLSLPNGRGWAVGTRLDRGQWRAVAMRRTPERWRRADPPMGGREGGLLGVARARRGPVLAVGWRADSTATPRPLIARHDGSRWRTERGAALPEGAAILTDVALGGRDEGWAVGYLVPDGSSRHEIVLEAWDGSSWSRVETPWADGISAIPRSVAVGTRGDLWVAGTVLEDAHEESRGFIASRRDGEWRLAMMAIPQGLRTQIMAVTPTKKRGAVAVGVVGSTSILLGTCRSERADDGAIRIRTGPKRAKARPDATDEGAAPSGERMLLAASVTAERPSRPPGFRVRDVAAEVGLRETFESWDALVADLDGDGWQDVLLNRHNLEEPRLAMGGPDGFTRDGPSDAFTLIDRHACDAADVDLDGALDVFCVVGRSRGKDIQRHELSLRPGFADGSLARDSLGLVDPLGRGRKVAFLRLDDDEYPEVFLTVDPERIDGLPSTNRFFRNVGGEFVPARDVGLDRPVGGDCAWAGDLDEDGDDDLLHCVTLPDDRRPAGLRLHRNDGGALVEASRELGVRPMGDIDVVVVDLTGDGRPDLVQLSETRLRVSRRTDRGFRTIYEAQLRDGAAVAAGDASGDGIADLYVVRAGAGAANEPDLLLVNGGRGRRFTSVRVPQAKRGKGDDVVAFDHDRNGLMDFLVVNGRATRGPVQLLASFPRE